MPKKPTKPDPRLKGSPRWEEATLRKMMEKLRGEESFDKSVSQEAYAMWTAFYEWVQGKEFDPTDEVELREISKAWRDREGHPKHSPRTMRSAMRQVFGDAVIATRTKSKRITGAPTEPKALMKFMIA